MAETQLAQALPLLREHGFVVLRGGLTRARKSSEEITLPWLTKRQLREALDYPPFGHLALFRVSSPERQHAEVEAERLSRRIQAHDAGQAIRLQGPMPAPVERARGRWRYQLLCRCRSRSVLGGILKRVQAELADTPPPASVHITLDVDPMTFM